MKKTCRRSFLILLALFLLPTLFSACSESEKASEAVTGEEMVNKIVVTINCIEGFDDEPKMVPFDFVLVLEDCGWKLDSWFDYGKEVTHG